MRRLSTLQINALGVTLTALVVWFGGPLLVVGDGRPLQGVVSRAFVIALVVAWRIAAILAGRAKARRDNRKFIDEMVTEIRSAGGSPADPAIAKRFTEALETMRNLRLTGGGRKRWARELPWYVLIGPPGSGKTTALQNAGLKFPLAAEMGRQGISGIGGTRHCDWWLTDQAVMIDTAGRFTTQDSDAERDARDWQGFLRLLARYRPRQPVNGILVTVSVGDLLHTDLDEARRQAKATRRRIREIEETVASRFPVYLLVTKIDLLAGFIETFEPFDGRERAQVWGVTLPFAHDGRAMRDAAESRQTWSELWRERSRSLVARLERLTARRLGDERDLRRREAIQGFTDQFEQLVRALDGFVKEAFADAKGRVEADPADKRSALLRGVYFTSGTQEGRPIDRVLGSIGRTLRENAHVLPTVRASGKGFFLSQLLERLVFAEAGIAGTNPEWQRRRARMAWGMVAASVVAAAGAIALIVTSTINNSGYVAEVGERAERLAKAVDGARATMTLPAWLPVYQSLRDLPQTADATPENAPFAYRAGLFQGAKLDAAARQRYYHLLDETLAPELARRLLGALRVAPSPATTAEQYEALASYVMLSEPGRMDRERVKRWFTQSLVGDPTLALGDESREALAANLDELLARNAFLSVIGKDTTATDEARRALKRTPLARRAVLALEREGVGADVRAFRLEDVVGADGMAAFTTRKDAASATSIPSIYTAQGFTQVVARLPRVVERIAGESSWVLDERPPTNVAAVTDEALAFYLEEYARRWDALAHGIEARTGETLAESLQTARLLATSDSPLAKLLGAMGRELRLAAPEGASPATRAAVKAIDERFAPIQRFASGDAAATDAMTKTTEAIGALATTLADADPSRPDAAVAVPRAANAVRAQAQALPDPARTVLDSLVSSVSLRNEQRVRESMKATLQQSIGEFCKRAIDGRFPFVADAKTDVSAADFVRLFGPGGLLDDFFTKHLAAAVDTSGATWRYKDAAAGLPSEATLEQFQRAARIRAAFFPSGRGMAASRLELKPLDMDNEILQFVLDVDGQQVRYAHGPSLSKAVEWPGPSRNFTVRMQTLPPGASGPAGTAFAGPWALLRLFEHAKVAPKRGTPDTFGATFRVDGRDVQFDVKASTVVNPARLPELRAFRCPADA